MSTTITINSYQFKGLDEFFVAGAVVTGVYYALPPLGQPPEAGPAEYDESRVNFPGRDGTGIKRSGFIRRPIYVDLVVVNSLAGAESAAKSTLDDFRQLARYTIMTPGGVSYPGCRLAGCGRPSRENLAAGYVGIILPLTFEQLSLEN